MLELTKFHEFVVAVICIVGGDIARQNNRFARNDRRVVGNVNRNRATCADADVVADFDIADDVCAGTDEDIIADCRHAGIFAVEKSVAADRHILKDRATRADSCAYRDRNAFEAVRRVERFHAFAHRHARTEQLIDVSALRQCFFALERRSVFVECLQATLPKHFLQSLAAESIAESRCLPDRRASINFFKHRHRTTPLKKSNPSLGLSHSNSRTSVARTSNADSCR